jgi:hypothetical protein
MSTTEDHSSTAEEEIDIDRVGGEGASYVVDFNNLKKALLNVKSALTPYDWVEFSKEFETSELNLSRKMSEKKLKVSIKIGKF